MSHRSASLHVANVTEESRWGGPQARIALIAERLKHCGVTTTVVLGREDSAQFRALLRERGVPFECVSLSMLSRGLGALLRYLSTFPMDVLRLVRLFNASKYDLIHCNGWWQIRCWMAAKIAGVPVVWHMNDTMLSEPISRLIGWLAMHYSDGIICSSDVVRKRYFGARELGDVPSVNIFPPVDCDSYDPDKIKPSRAIDAGEGITVTTVCNINPIKGLEVFLEAANKANCRLDSAVSFFIVGPRLDTQRSYYRQIREQAERIDARVSFIGQSDQVPAVLKASDIFLCSSWAEAGPMTVFEAMAMQLPVVSTRVGAVPELFLDEDGLGELVVEPGDAEGMAEAVIRLAEDSEYRSKVGRRLREIALSEVDVEQAARRHMRLYERVAEGRSRSQDTDTYG